MKHNKRGLLAAVTSPPVKSSKVTGGANGMPSGFKDEEIDEVREGNSLVDVVSEYLTLGKKGRYYWGLCPFHKEKTPSFKVDPALQLYHCFGCQEGGNVFTFLMRVEGLDFPEAVKSLADRIGYRLSYEAQRESGRSTLKLKALEAHRKAADFYHDFLMKGNQAQLARDYLKNRGFGAEVISRYKIGFAAPDWDRLFKLLSGEGFDSEVLTQSGLVIKGEKGFYDRFRGRVVFPILDAKSRPVAFGGRALGDETPKYINSPETPIYHKGALLYGLPQARSDVVSSAGVLVAEGYTDVVALAQAGFRNVVGTLGTAFTLDQVELLSRYADRIYLVFDADAAGVAAAERSQTFMSEFKLPGYERIGDLTGKKAEVLVVVLPEGTDPADYIGQSGAKAFESLIDGARPLVDFCIERVLARYDLDRTSEKIRAGQEAVALISNLPVPMAQEGYLKQLSSRLSLSLESLVLELKRRRGDQGKRLQESGPAACSNTGKARAEKEMLQLLLQRPDLGELADNLDEEHFADPANRGLYIRWRNFARSPDTGGDFFADLEGDTLTLASELALSTPPADKDGVKGYFEQLSVKLKEQALGRKICHLKQELKDLEKKEDEERYDSVFRELIALETARKHLRYNVF